MQIQMHYAKVIRDCAANDFQSHSMMKQIQAAMDIQDIDAEKIQTMAIKLDITQLIIDGLYHTIPIYRAHSTPISTSRCAIPYTP